jgi:hypothetical protein
VYCPNPNLSFTLTEVLRWEHAALPTCHDSSLPPTAVADQVLVDLSVTWDEQSEAAPCTTTRFTNAKHHFSQVQGRCAAPRQQAVTIRGSCIAARDTRRCIAVIYFNSPLCIVKSNIRDGLGAGPSW